MDDSLKTWCKSLYQSTDIEASILATCFKRLANRYRKIDGEVTRAPHHKLSDDLPVAKASRTIPIHIAKILEEPNVNYVDNEFCIKLEWKADNNQVSLVTGYVMSVPPAYALIAYSPDCYDMDIYMKPYVVDSQNDGMIIFDFYMKEPRPIEFKVKFLCVLSKDKTDARLQGPMDVIYPALEAKKKGEVLNIKHECQVNLRYLHTVVDVCVCKCRDVIYYKATSFILIPRKRAPFIYDDQLLDYIGLIGDSLISADCDSLQSLSFMPIHKQCNFKLTDGWKPRATAGRGFTGALYDVVPQYEELSKAFKIVVKNRTYKKKTEKYGESLKICKTFLEKNPEEEDEKKKDEEKEEEKKEEKEEEETAKEENEDEEETAKEEEEDEEIEASQQIIEVEACGRNAEGTKEKEGNKRKPEDSSEAIKKQCK